MKSITNVGMWLFRWSWIVLYIGETMVFFVWLFKGRKFVEFFSSLREFVENDCELDLLKRKRPRYCGLFINYLWVTYSLVNIFFEKKDTIAEMVVCVSFKLHLYIRLSVTVLLFNAVFERLANAVLFFTQQATAPVSVCVADHDAGVVPKISEHLLLESLTDLEKKLIQVRMNVCV